MSSSTAAPSLVHNNCDNNIAVIGLGAMGGGMARALLQQQQSVARQTVTGYDTSPSLCHSFWEEAQAADNNTGTGVAVPTTQESSSPQPPTCLREAIDPVHTQVVLVVVQNEAQCERVCFGGGGADKNDDGLDDKNVGLCHLLPSGACVIICSTVSPDWVRKAAARFDQRPRHNIHLVDAPISGGPARARSGELTVMASAGKSSAGEGHRLDAATTDTTTRHPPPPPPHFYESLVKPVLEAMTTGAGGRGCLHWIPGGVGMGSTLKLVHQLLAGVHIAAGAEALALAATAGLDTHQVLDVVRGAAGASWMLNDRGPRMITPPDQRPPPVQSALDIFVKDLDLCYQEAKRVQSPIPLASAALQQFISGQRLGLGRLDDSQVVRVYETITGVSVGAQTSPADATTDTTDAAAAATAPPQDASPAASIPGSATKVVDGTRVGDVWHLDDGTMETILEVANEPRHRVVLHNKYVRAIKVEFPPGDTTLAHRHDEDSLYFFFATLPVTNYVQGVGSLTDSLEMGEIRYGTHKSDVPLVHKITNNSVDTPLLCIDAEVLFQPPLVSVEPLPDTKHLRLVKSRPKCRVYRLEVPPGQCVSVHYPFFHLSVVLQPGRIRFGTPEGGGRHKCEWTQDCNRSDVAWKEPTTSDVLLTNVGSTTFVEYIAEWC